MSPRLHLVIKSDNPATILVKLKYLMTQALKF